MDQRKFVNFNWSGEITEERIEDEEVVPPGQGILERVRRGLVQRGFASSQVEQHDSYGWYIYTNVDGIKIWSMLQDSGPWLIITEAHYPFMHRLLGRTSPKPLASVCTAIHEVLGEVPECSSIQWFTRSEFQHKKGANGASSPSVA